MTKEELITILRSNAQTEDTASAHVVVDNALIDYINDPEITAAYQAVKKWYS